MFTCTNPSGTWPTQSTHAFCSVIATLSMRPWGCPQYSGSSKFPESKRVSAQERATSHSILSSTIYVTHSHGTPMSTGCKTPLSLGFYSTLWSTPSSEWTTHSSLSQDRVQLELYFRKLSLVLWLCGCVWMCGGVEERREAMRPSIMQLGIHSCHLLDFLYGLNASRDSGVLSQNH